MVSTASEPISSTHTFKGYLTCSENRLRLFFSRSVNHEIAIIRAVILVEAAIDSLVPIVGLITPLGICKVSDITIPTEKLIASLVPRKWSLVDQRACRRYHLGLELPQLFELASFANAVERVVCLVEANARDAVCMNDTMINIPNTIRNVPFFILVPPVF